MAHLNAECGSNVHKWDRGIDEPEGPAVGVHVSGGVALEVQGVVEDGGSAEAAGAGRWASGGRPFRLGAVRGVAGGTAVGGRRGWRWSRGFGRGPRRVRFVLRCLGGSLGRWGMAGDGSILGRGRASLGRVDLAAGGRGGHRRRLLPGDRRLLVGRLRWRLQALRRSVGSGPLLEVVEAFLEAVI